MFEDFEAKYDDFCWYEITGEQSKTNLEEQAKREIGSSSPLYAIKDRLKAVAKSERQDDVLFFDGEKYYVIHLTWTKAGNGEPRYKDLLPDELPGYFEWYYSGGI